MSKLITVRNQRTGAIILNSVRGCSGFCKIRGLQFAEALHQGEGLLFIAKYRGRVTTTVHTFFVRFEIAVIWLDEKQQVVDQAVAKPWRVYVPASPAQYTIESAPDVCKQVRLGDTLAFIPEV